MTLDQDAMSMFQSALAPDTPRSLLAAGLGGDNAASDWDGILLEEPGASFLWGGGEQSPRNARAGGNGKVAPRTARAAQLAHMHQQGSGNSISSINAFATESVEDTSPIDMAVFVVFHVASRSKNAQQILAMLQTETAPTSVTGRTAAFAAPTIGGGAKGGVLTISTEGL